MQTVAQWNASHTPASITTEEHRQARQSERTQRTERRRKTDLRLTLAPLPAGWESQSVCRSVSACICLPDSASVSRWRNPRGELRHRGAGHDEVPYLLTSSTWPSKLRAAAFLSRSSFQFYSSPLRFRQRFFQTSLSFDLFSGSPLSRRTSKAKDSTKLSPCMQGGPRRELGKEETVPSVPPHPSMHPIFQ